MSKKMVSLRIDEELLKYLEERAEKEHRTLSNTITGILIDSKESIDRHDGEIKNLEYKLARSERINLLLINEIKSIKEIH